MVDRERQIDNYEKIARRNELREKGERMEDAVPTLEDPEEQAELEAMRMTPDERNERTRLFARRLVKGPAHLVDRSVGVTGAEARHGRYCINCSSPLGTCSCTYETS